VSLGFTPDHPRATRASVGSETALRLSNRQGLCGEDRDQRRAKLPAQFPGPHRTAPMDPILLSGIMRFLTRPAARGQAGSARIYIVQRATLKRTCQARFAEHVLPDTFCQTRFAEAHLPKHICRSTLTKAHLPKQSARIYIGQRATLKRICRSTFAEAYLPKRICRSTLAEAHLPKHTCRHEVHAYI